MNEPDPGAASGGCVCSCHLRRDGEPVDELHDGGRTCPCRLSPQENRAARAEAMRKLQEWWDSPEFKEMRAREEADERAAREWGARHGVHVGELSGPVPVVVDGEVVVDGTPVPFWFRERHELWALHLGDMDGEVVATGDASEYESTTELVELIGERVRRTVRTRVCPHPQRDARWRYCPLCGTALKST